MLLVANNNTESLMGTLSTIKSRSGHKPWNEPDEKPRYHFVNKHKYMVYFTTCHGILAYQKGDRYYNAITHKRIV